MQPSITLALTGASGAAYGIELLRQLRFHYKTIYVLLSDAARIVVATELNWSLPDNLAKCRQILDDKTAGGDGKLEVCAHLNWMSPVASGSAAPKQMIICPCSTGTISAIATGASNNLLERAADVVLKEKGQLILVPRETPFSTIHLQNMLTLAQAGATVMPAAPGFYHKPTTIDDLIRFLVGRILDHLNIDHQLMERWGYKNKPLKADINSESSSD